MKLHVLILGLSGCIYNIYFTLSTIRDFIKGEFISCPPPRYNKRVVTRKNNPIEFHINMVVMIFFIIMAWCALWYFLEASLM